MIKEVTIKNFKIFKGLHRITLSANDVAPVTVVSTITASGKTTFINAVYWCLYGRLLEDHSTMLNHERAQEMGEGEIETVEVELVYTEHSEEQRVYRSAAFQKTGGRVMPFPEFDRCSTNNGLLLPEFLAPTMFLSEPFSLTYRPRFQKMVKGIINAFLKKYRALSKEKTEEVKQIIMLKIADSASIVFNELYFRPGTYRIIWNDVFSVLRTDINQLRDDLSDTDEMVFQISVLHGIREILFEKNNTTLLPIFIDDIFMRSDRQQFSLEHLMQTLGGRQVVVLAHQNSLAEQSLSDLCGALYTMNRTENWTNVSIQKVKTR